MKFRAGRTDYFHRLRKEFLFGFLVLTGVVLFVHLKNDDISNPTSILITAGVISVSGIGLGLAAHMKARMYFYEVELTEQNIILWGDSMNRPLIIELPLRETNILLKSKGNRVNAEYFIKFKHGSRTYDINRLFTWHYATLLELFYSFKQAKNEKVIWDEKYVLELMKKKIKR